MTEAVGAVHKSMILSANREQATLRVGVCDANTLGGIDGASLTTERTVRDRLICSGGICAWVRAALWRVSGAAEGGRGHSR